MTAEQEHTTRDMNTAQLLLRMFMFKQLTGQRVRDVVLVAAHSGEETAFSWGDKEHHTVATQLARSASLSDTRQ
jgi:hypothetical protein